LCGHAPNLKRIWGMLLTGLNNYGTGEGNSEIIGKQGGDMPRQARLDAPGTLHHINENTGLVFKALLPDLAE
jgi:hypothetical protein